jgi:transposase
MRAVLAELKTFLDRALDQISGKSTLAQAIRCATSRWPALTRYTTDGRLEMTNNAVERAIRPPVMTDSFCTSSSSVWKH